MADFFFPVVAHLGGDGDTPLVRVWRREPADLGFGERDLGVQLDIAVRLLGCNLPEIKGPERLAGEAARSVAAAWFTYWLLRGRVLARSIQWDKFGGRIDGDFIPQPAADSLVTFLLAAHVGKPWNGMGRKPGFSPGEVGAVIAASQLAVSDLTIP